VSSRQKVLASNSGLVSFIGDLSLSGNTIVIDHGFGLSTVYAHLSEVSVKLGDEVQKGQTIGRTGTSGFSQSEEVYFEMRLHGVPVSPNEWWDESWVTDHVTNKIAFVQRTVLGDASK
jgi:murein DD-endopeptidase MepM/ murein hydrolase activator NlpD